MIRIIDVGGNEKFINCELIEKIERIPDTLITLVNGHTFIARETAESIIGQIIEYKRRCQARFES